MAKEVSTGKDIDKKTPLSKDEIQLALIDNFISLQKVMANLTVKFDVLSSNISKLLELFEISAKTFAEKYSGEAPAPSTVVDEEYLKKLDTLLNQNKIISKGIMLIEEKLRDRTDYEPAPDETMNYPQMQRSSNLPSMQQQNPYQQLQPTQMLPTMQQPQSPSPYKKEIGARQETSPKQLPKY